ncbi:phage baseplate assembly protein V [Azohydromonas lata]|uniref:Phage baseplate assembly protein V n=1 Tax=Azohydromonas lata TaxID=45677 RepID=A0ABU5IDU2_9BURK|nr:phage baseplate assembly protein V [Azohydromonas lata]MDZ5456999.1 phage baseplate assembly protein V [Azohydromonas lata]
MVAASFAEQSRLLLNLIRLGTIAEVDHGGTRCRVRSGQLLTAWLPWVTLRAGTTCTWSPPTVGEQGLLLAPGGDLAAAIVLLGINSDAHPAPSDDPDVTTTHYPDGAVTSYDHAAHALSVTLPAGGTVDLTAPGSVTVHSPSITLDAEQTTCTGQMLVQGLFTYQAGMAGSGSAGRGAAAVIQGTVETTNDVIANGISLTGHTHTGVRAGGESSGGPQ